MPERISASFSVFLFDDFLICASLPGTQQWRCLDGGGVRAESQPYQKEEVHLEVVWFSDIQLVCCVKDLSEIFEKAFLHNVSINQFNGAQQSSESKQQNVETSAQDS